MKKSIYFTALMFILSQYVSAQQTSYIVNDKNHLFMGPIVQLNIIGIANQNNYGFQEMGYGVPFGYSVGFTAGKEWSRKHRIETSLQYSNAGQSYRSDVGDAVLRKEVSLSYVQLPVMYKRGIYYLSDTKSEYLINLGIGLQAGYLTSADIEWKNEDEVQTMLTFLTQGANPRQAELEALLPPSGQPKSYDELFQKVDVSALMSLSCVYKTSLNWMLEFELRGSYSLNDMNSEDWRLENRNNTYEASRNISAGFRVAALYTIWN